MKTDKPQKQGYVKEQDIQLTYWTLDIITAISRGNFPF